MTYEEAQEISLQVKWKTNTCNQGEQCWCRTIVPVVPILYSEYENSVGTGQVHVYFPEPANGFAQPKDLVLSRD